MPSHSNKRVLTDEDLKRIKLVSDPHISPDGFHIAWVVTKIDDDNDTHASSIWLSDRDGGNARQLTSGNERDASPRWSPDSKTIAFASNRRPMLTPPSSEKKDDGEKESEKDSKKKDQKKAEGDSNRKHNPQIWTIRIDGGEAMQVTNHPNGASSHTWAPDGSALAYVASDDVTDNDDFKAPMTNGGVADERVIRDMRYRFDGTGFRERYSHIWKVHVVSGDSSQLTFGDVNDGDPQWAPAGDLIAFVGNRREDHKTLVASTILAVPADGGAVIAMAPDDAAFDSPAWSSDGSRLAFVGHLDAMANTKNDTLWTVSASGKDEKNHTEAWDTSIGDFGMSDVSAGSDTRPRWQNDSSIVFLASARGETQIHTLDLQSSSVTALTSGKRRISGFSHDGAGFVCVSGNIHQPFELYASDAGGENETQLSQANQSFMDEVALSEAIDLEVKSADGWEIQAWLLPPANLDRESSATFPLIVQIHGGPHAMYGYAMFHEMQLMAARGYGVLFCNPRGSAGYGEHFNACTRARWGESDMPDIIASLETAIDQHDWINTDRLGITGGSYGGYLTNWIVSHDDRFKAAVTQRCVSNFYSFFGTSDIGVNFGEFEFGGVPWKDAELLLKHSPLSYVDQIYTPLLIIHSELDLRCPIEQAEQMFVALKYLGREVGFVRIPNESHDLSRSGTPSRRLARLHHMLGWFQNYL